MKHLTLDQRYRIEFYQSMGKSLSETADYVGKGKSVISREISRNRHQRSGVYKADLANRKAMRRQADKPKRCDLDDAVKATIAHYLGMKYSPEQMVGREKLESREMVSKETIYKYVWGEKRKGGRLHLNLRSKGKRYAKRGLKTGKRGIVAGRVDIDQRPKIVEEKQRLGDLEIDLVVGKGHKGALLTINDRATGMLLMDKVENKAAAVVAAKAVELLAGWKPWINTVTSDNGKEFANHKSIAQQLEIDFYFAKPYHSWERGANENLNGLVRQYFPKGMEFDNITKEQIEQATEQLNNRPRKRYGFQTPNEIFNQKINTNVSVAFIT